jgi:hypothetical protein
MPNPYLAAALADQQAKRVAVVAEAEGYDALTIPALRDEISRRNEGRAEDEHVTPKGANKPDLIKALEADDRNHSAEES